jgi:hypothetical protein
MGAIIGLSGRSDTSKMTISKFIFAVRFDSTSDLQGVAS